MDLKWKEKGGIWVFWLFNLCRWAIFILHFEINFEAFQISIEPKILKHRRAQDFYDGGAWYPDKPGRFPKFYLNLSIIWLTFFCRQIGKKTCFLFHKFHFRRPKYAVRTRCRYRAPYLCHWGRFLKSFKIPSKVTYFIGNSTRNSNLSSEMQNSNFHFFI